MVQFFFLSETFAGLHSLDWSGVGTRDSLGLFGYTGPSDLVSELFWKYFGSGGRPVLGATCFAAVEICQYQKQPQPVFRALLGNPPLPARVSRCVNACALPVHYHRRGTGLGSGLAGVHLTWLPTPEKNLVFSHSVSRLGCRSVLLFSMLSEDLLGNK